MVELRKPPPGLRLSLNGIMKLDARIVTALFGTTASLLRKSTVCCEMPQESRPADCYTLTMKIAEADNSKMTPAIAFRWKMLTFGGIFLSRRTAAVKGMIEIES